jgi:membrane protein YdbS with pleckstrin-like domain
MKIEKRAFDAGLQPERTALSWSRTLLVLLINVLMVIRVGYSNQNPTVLYAGVALAILMVIFYVFSVFRSAGFSLNRELTTQGSIRVKQCLSAVLCVTALLVALSSAMNIFRLFVGGL